MISRIAVGEVSGVRSRQRCPQGRRVRVDGTHAPPPPPPSTTTTTTSPFHHQLLSFPLLRLNCSQGITRNSARHFPGRAQAYSIGGAFPPRGRHQEQYPGGDPSREREGGEGEPELGHSPPASHREPPPGERLLITPQAGRRDGGGDVARGVPLHALLSFVTYPCVCLNVRGNGIFMSIVGKCFV